MIHGADCRVEHLFDGEEPTARRHFPGSIGAGEDKFPETVGRGRTALGGGEKSADPDDGDARRMRHAGYPYSQEATAVESRLR